MTTYNSQISLTIMLIKASTIILNYLSKIMNKRNARKMEEWGDTQPLKHIREFADILAYVPEIKNLLQPYTTISIYINFRWNSTQN